MATIRMNFLHLINPSVHVQCALGCDHSTTLLCFFKGDDYDNVS